MSINRHGDTWLEVERWAEDELAELRESNDDPDNTEIETAVIRGEIARLKKLLALPEAEEPPVRVQTVRYD